MNRRNALLIGLGALLGACGGGGAGSIAGADTGPGASATPAPAATSSSQGMSRDIAMWGDSLTTLVAPNLQLMVPDRTVFNQGYVGWTSSQIAAVELADTSHRDWVSTFWYGHNNKSEPAQIKADIAASVAHLAPGNTRFIVLGLVNRADGSESRGTAAYDALLALNAELAATYPANYIDMRAWLVSHYDPNLPEDVADFNADVPPASLRSDEIHLQNAGSILVAQRVKQFIDAKGW